MSEAISSDAAGNDTGNKVVDVRFTCPECGKRRINTPSGSVCPDGHGKLYPSIDSDIGGVTISGIPDEREDEAEPEDEDDEDDEDEDDDWEDDWDDEDDEDDWEDDDDDWNYSSGPVLSRFFPLEAHPPEKQPGMVISLSGVLQRAADVIQRSKGNQHLEFPLRQLNDYIEKLRSAQSDAEAAELLAGFLRLWVKG